MESLNYLLKIVDQISDLPLENLEVEEQNKDYQGLTFSIGQQTFRSRKAKITPKKLGYFVAFWEKDAANKNQPYESISAPEKLIITIFDQEKVGQFIFPKAILAEQHILTTGSIKGKMALRLYPDWVMGLNKTASKTQQWQSPYFIDLTDTWDVSVLQQLYFD
ncbi:MepB family protein [Enterococcus rotai]|uniref:MepB family protein n=1 Tax=Enterococcus rotai TaxID=118060 RepID=UPI0035C6FD7F